ncbi:MAG: DUF255 domain-containing protein, partial [Bacteroidota bacterium]
MKFPSASFSLDSLLLWKVGCLLLLAFSSCQAQAPQQKASGEHAYTNALVDSKSPYLLQHAHNPVNWQPWGEDALEMAQKEEKLVLISVGYAACHWCHVMEHESFEDTAVARLMNEHFVQGVRLRVDGKKSLRAGLV